MPKPVAQAANMGISRRQLPTMQCEKGHEGAHRNTKPRPLISLSEAASLCLLAYFEDRHSWWLKWVQPNQAPSGLSLPAGWAGCLEGLPGLTMYSTNSKRPALSSHTPTWCTVIVVTTASNTQTGS